MTTIRCLCCGKRLERRTAGEVRRACDAEWVARWKAAGMPPPESGIPADEDCWEDATVSTLKERYVRTQFIAGMCWPCERAALADGRLIEKPAVEPTPEE